KVFWTGDPSRPWLPLCIGILGAAVGWIGSMALTRHPLAEQMISVLQMWRFAAQAHTQENSASGHANAMVKVIAYRSGMLGAYHRFRNRGQLTVAMFHRILPVDDLRYLGADPEWTMTPNSFARCLQFFRSHYNVVSPEQVFAALRGEGHLPRRSLLVTFDDGWGDTAEYAQPILDAYSIPSLVFVVGSAIDRSTPFWEEAIYALLSTHAEGYAQLRQALKPFGVILPEVPPTQMNEKSIRAIISRLSESDRLTLESVTGSLGAAYGNNAAMLDCEQLVKLDASIHTIGGHGMSHQPLTSVMDIQNEMISAQASISAYLNKPKIESMSFPHGAYSDSVIAHCRSVGYKYLFSSDAHLNTLDDKTGTYSPVGRIHISERWITNKEGEFQPALLATWLFLRPTVNLH
ncbi:MAG: polysaccharide deacetylase family protein, partial [Herminiimonas sp.]|nr:polysaccharide deacetylase family protein [Herminiimonas sp.]